MDSSRLAARAGSVNRLHTAAPALAGALIVPLLAQAAPQPGAAAPDIAAKDFAGRNQRLSEYRGEVVLLTFWASWCGQCRSTLRAVADAAAGDGVTALGVNLDRDAGRAAALARTIGADFPSLHDAGQHIGRLYDVQQLPLTLAIDQEGVVRAVWSRDPVTPGELARVVAGARQ